MENATTVMLPWLLKKKEDADEQSCSDVSDKDIQSSPGNSDDTEPVVENSPPRKRRRSDVDPVDIEDEDKLCSDSCGCACGCRVFPNRYPMMKCMNCQQAICSGCRHVGSQGGILCHVCRNHLVGARKENGEIESSTMASEVVLQVIIYEFEEDRCHQMSITKHSALIGQEDWYSDLVEIDHCLFHCSCRAFERGLIDNTFLDDHVAEINYTPNASEPGRFSGIIRSIP
jgi:hypothetical protein